MAKRKGAVLVECSRCPRQEYLPEDEADPVAFSARLGSDPPIQFSDLCKACQSTIRAALQELAKAPTKASRGSGGKKQDDDS